MSTEAPSLLMQGAEGRVFTRSWLGRDVVVKQRLPKKYRHPALDEQLTKDRLKAEARTLIRCLAAGIPVPALYDVNMMTAEFVLERIANSVTVRQFLHDSVHSEIKLSLTVFDLAQEVGRVLGLLHANDIIHGDLTTSNMLVKKEENATIFLIDFGLSFVSEQVEDKAVDLYVLERAVLSTHPDSGDFMEEVLKSYSKSLGEKKAKSIIARLSDVRSRGRKKLCFG